MNVAPAGIQHVDLRGIDVESRDPESLACDDPGQGQADIAHADDADIRVATVQPLHQAADPLTSLNSIRHRGGADVIGISRCKFGHSLPRNMA